MSGGQRFHQTVFRFPWVSGWFFFATLSACNPLISNPTIQSNFNPGVPQLRIKLPASLLYPAAGENPPAVQGNSINFPISAQGNGLVSLSCTYETVGLSSQDPNFVAPGEGTGCEELDTLSISSSGTVSVTHGVSRGVWVSHSGMNEATGAISWTPNSRQRGTYRFILAATDAISNTASDSIFVTVRENYSTAEIAAVFDATAADGGASSPILSTPVEPRINSNNNNNSTESFANAAGTAPGILNFGTLSPYQGTGRTSTISVDPYALAFDGTNDALNLGPLLAGYPQFTIETWVKPSSPSTANSVLLGNGGGRNNGMVIRQSTPPTNRAEFVVGQKYYSYRDLVLSDQPVGYWRLNEASGTVAKDLSAYGNSATYHGTVTLSAQGSLNNSGDSDSAVGFDGSTGYALAPFSSSLPTGSSPRTLEAWINPSVLPASGNRGCIVSYGTAAVGQAQAICIYNTSGTYQVGYYGDGPSVATNYAIPVGSWTYVAVTYDGSIAKIYINNNSPVVFSGISWNTGSALGIGIGYFSNTYFFAGEIDEVAVYNQALSPAEILNHYNSGNYQNNSAYNVPYPGNAVLADKPVGYWRFGEKAGLTAYDVSGNGNNGTYATSTTLGQVGALSGAGDSSTSILTPGSTTGVTVANNSVLNPDSTVSVELWAKLNSVNSSYCILASKDNGIGWHIEQYINQGKIQLRVDTSAGSNQANHGGANVFNNSWNHIAMTLNHGSKILYINGILATSGTYSVGTGFGITGGNTGVLGAGLCNGNYSELAIYNYVLSPAQIANHYNSGLGAGWWFCQSQSQMTSSAWALFSGIYNGTSAKLFVNGQQECSVQPGTTYSSSQSLWYGAYAGASGVLSDFWSGLVSYVSAYIASLTASEVAQDFSAIANRFRSVPVEDIVTQNLVAHLDAANSQLGNGPFANGCPTSATSWFNLSPLASNATLFNFASCGTTLGWYNSGSSNGPFSLNFNGGAQTVAVPLSLGSGDSTYEAWVNPSAVVVGSAIVTGTVSLFMGGGNNWQFGNAYLNNSISLNSWAHVVGVQSVSMNNIYVNGAFLASTAGSSSSISQLVIGTGFKGAISVLRVYSTALSAAQIRQNCLAQEDRFGTTVCASPF